MPRRRPPRPFDPELLTQLELPLPPPRHIDHAAHNHDYDGRPPCVDGNGDDPLLAALRRTHALPT